MQQQQSSEQYDQQAKIKQAQQINIFRPFLYCFGFTNSVYIFGIIGSLSWVFAFIYCNENNFSFIQTSFVRGLSLTIGSFFFIKQSGSSIQYKNTSNFKYQTIINSVFIIQGLFFGLVQFFLPLPIVHTINCSGPIFVFIVDYFLNGVKTTRSQIIGILIVFIGLMLVVNGAAFMKMYDPNYQIKTTFQNYISDNPVVLTIVALLQLFTMFIWSFGCVFVKRLKGINVFQINFYFGLMIWLSAAFLYPILVTDPVPISKLLLAIPFSGILFILNAIFAIASFALAKDTRKVTIIAFISIIAGYLISVIRYGEPINMFCLSGSVLITYGVIKVIM